MDIKEVYEEVLPYLSDPKAIWEFLELNKDGTLSEIIMVIEETLPGSESSLKTDLRILLNAISKQE
jgi:hypothetical protein